MGAGSETFRRYPNVDQAIVHTINAAQSILESFISKTKSANCSVITSCDFNSKYGLAKYLLTDKPIKCFNLSDKWAYSAIQSAKEGLEKDINDLRDNTVSCASEIIKKMNGNIEEQVMHAEL